LIPRLMKPLVDIWNDESIRVFWSRELGQYHRLEFLFLLGRITDTQIDHAGHNDYEQPPIYDVIFKYLLCR
jgi:hypothetical protein